MTRKAASVRDGNAGPKATPSDSMSNEQILNALHQIYVHPEHGLLSIGKTVGLLNLFAPRRKVNIMLMGNHSSGKSSFINWYIEANVQKTGVAIETQGFSFVTCARKRETLTGTATMRVFPFLKPLEDVKGVVAYLNTELVPSQSRRFNVVTFIDTPGLADGELSYPYDIERAITFLGEKVDLIFVFIDPIGQALCKRTLSLVESLSGRYSERMRFFLSKADEAGDEADRQKVLMQIVQELCKRPGLDQSGFEMLTVYIPDHRDLKQRNVMCTNQIDDVCKMIDNTIALTIQKSFEQTERDLNQIEELVDSSLKLEHHKKGRNWKNFFKLLLINAFALQFPASILMHQDNAFGQFFDRYIQISSHTAPEIAFYPLLVFQFVVQIYSFLTYELFRIQRLCITSQNLTVISFAAFTLPIFIAARFLFRFSSTMKGTDLRSLRQSKQSLADARQKREELFSSYLNQMLLENDYS